MKKVLILSIVMSAFLVSCGGGSTTDKSAETMEIPSKDVKVAAEVLAENREEVKMEVDGMTCAMGCAKYIEDKVGDMNGVVASSVNFEDKIATFEFDKTVTSPDEIEQFINDIHDGQYKAKIATTNAEVEIDENKNASEEESAATIKERINVSFPQLFTYFIRKIR